MEPGARFPSVALPLNAFRKLGAYEHQGAPTGFLHATRRQRDPQLMPSRRRAFGLSFLVLLSVLFATSGPAVAVTNPGEWGSPSPLLEESDIDVQFPTIAADDNGNAMAVWLQRNGSRYDVWAKRLVSGLGWQAATLVDGNDTGDAYSPEVAMDASGNALVVWHRFDGTRNNVWAATYVGGVGWRAPTLLEAGSYDAQSPRVGISPPGDGMAVWQQSDGTRYNIWASRFAWGTGWEAATLIENLGPGDAREPRIAVDNGGAITLWKQDNGSFPDLWANQYVDGSGWQVPGLVESRDGVGAIRPEIAGDGVGNAVAIWVENDGTRRNISANTHVSGNGWGVASLIENDNTGDATDPQIAVNNRGNAVAVWIQSDGVRQNVWSALTTIGGTWAAPVQIEEYDGGYVFSPRIAIDGYGNAIAVWAASDGVRADIWANRYVEGLGWTTARLIESDDSGSAAYPRIAMVASGNGAVVWQLQAPSLYTDIWVNWFIEDNPPALQVTAPLEGQATNESAILVEGSTEPDATLSANGVAASVEPDGSFRLRVALPPGASVVNVTARDALGNRVTVFINVTYVDALPVLERQLAATQADLAAAQADVSAAQAALATTQAELAAAQTALDGAEARVAILEQDANVTGAELAAAQVNLTIEQARVAALEGQADATAAEIGVAQARLATLEASAAATEAELEVTRADLTEAQAKLASAREDLDQSQNDGQAATRAAVSASSLATLAMILAVVGVAVGVGAMVVGMRARRGAWDTRSPFSSSPRPPPEKPPGLK